MYQITPPLDLLRALFQYSCSSVNLLVKRAVKSLIFGIYVLSKENSQTQGNPLFTTGHLPWARCAKWAFINSPQKIDSKQTLREAEKREDKE